MQFISCPRVARSYFLCDGISAAGALTQDSLLLLPSHNIHCIFCELFLKCFKRDSNGWFHVRRKIRPLAITRKSVSFSFLLLKISTNLSKEFFQIEPFFFDNVANLGYCRTKTVILDANILSRKVLPFIHADYLQDL